MTELDRLAGKLAELSLRVRTLEENVRPLLRLEGVDAELVSDQAILSHVAKSIGSTLPEITGRGRTREAAEARRRVAHLLYFRAQWSTAHIARNLNRTEAGIRDMLRQPAAHLST